MRCSRCSAARARQVQFAIALDAANNTAILARIQYRSGLTDFQQLLEAERSLALRPRRPRLQPRRRGARARPALSRARRRLGCRRRSTDRDQPMTDATRTDAAGNEAAPPQKAPLDEFLGAPAPKPWYKRPLYIGGIARHRAAGRSCCQPLLHRRDGQAAMRPRRCERGNLHRHRLGDRQSPADQRGPGRLRAVRPDHPGLRRQ